MFLDFFLRFLEWGFFAAFWALLIFAAAIGYEILLAARARLRKRLKENEGQRDERHAPAPVKN